MNGPTVIYAGNFELPDKNAAAHRVVNNAKLFRQLGFETVFLGVCRGEDYYDGIVKRDYGADFDIYEQSYPFSSKQWAKQIFDTRHLKTLVQMYPRTVAVILYNTQYATLLAAKKTFSKMGISVLYDCTEWNGFTEGSLLKKTVKKLDSRMIETFLPRRADGLIIVSTEMRTRYGNKKPLLLLPPLVDTSEPIWRQPTEAGQRFVFCYAGDPSNKDRLDLLLRAFSRLPADAAELRIVGLSADAYSEAQNADGWSVSPASVRFVGRLSHEDTVREILSCDCFVFLREPTRRNTAGFPTKFAEAYTCGVPIITTAVSDLPLYAGDDCIVLSDASEENVVGAMREMIARRNASRCLREAFDYGNFADDCSRWLERIPCTKD